MSYEQKPNPARVRMLGEKPNIPLNVYLRHCHWKILRGTRNDNYSVYMPERPSTPSPK